MGDLTDTPLISRRASGRTTLILVAIAAVGAALLIAL